MVVNYHRGANEINLILVLNIVVYSVYIVITVGIIKLGVDNVTVNYNVD